MLTFLLEIFTKKKGSWKKHAWIFVIFFVIIMVTNPEIRVLVIFVDAIGIDIFIMLVGYQFAMYWSYIKSLAQERFPVVLSSVSWHYFLISSCVFAALYPVYQICKYIFL